MKRTTIFLTEALERELQLQAAREGRSTASVVREALSAYVAQRRGPGTLPSFAGAFSSGRSDTAERHEELLFRRRETDSSASPRSSAPPRRAARGARRQGR
jgi:plasmid stability protein